MKMMIRKLNWFLLFVLLCGCSYVKNDVKSDDQLQNTGASFDGVWAEDTEANALFTIKGDTVVNFEHGDRMYFKVVGDTMLIDYGDSIGKHLILKHTQDSLVLQNEDKSITRLYKR
jgi:hypothetical protein